MSVQIVPPALLVCGSRASWPLRRADCQAAGIPVIALADNFRTGSLVGALTLGVGERDVAYVNDIYQAGMLRLIESFVQSSGLKTLLIEGGATAAAIAEHFGWTRFTVTARAPAGVGVLQPIGARAPLVVIKPGSYPWPREIWEQFRRCHLNRPDSLA